MANNGLSSSWTRELITALIELWPAGHSTAEIGRRLGFSKNAIVGKARRLGLDARPSPIRRDPNALPPPPSIPRPVFTLPPLFSETVSGPVRRPAVARPEPRPAPPPPRIDTTRTCEYIAGEGRPWKMCGAQAVLGKSYCPDCCGIVFVRRRDRDEAA